VPIFTLSIILALSAATHAALADFRVTPADSPAATAAADVPPPTPPPTGHVPPSSRPKRAVVRGFGEDVPLSFAVRQIVPHDVKVTYSSSVDPDQFVLTWQGGRPWLPTLRDAVSALGLRVIYRAHQITITL
jgi:hypothetical protein